MLLQLESTDRVKAVERLEEEQGISRADIQRMGKKVYVVCIFASRSLSDLPVPCADPTLSCI